MVQQRRQQARHSIIAVSKAFVCYIQQQTEVAVLLLRYYYQLYDITVQLREAYMTC